MNAAVKIAVGNTIRLLETARYRDCYWQRGTKFDFLSIFTYTIIDEEDKMSSASLILKKGKNPLSIVLFSKDIKKLITEAKYGKAKQST